MNRGGKALAFAAAGVLATSFASDSLAQTGAAERAISVYEAQFFAPFSVDNAFDMIGRVPGFQFDGGEEDVRGLAGAGGNVLIDGERPASKSESLEDILKRIPAKAVVQIDIIRGGAPGIDMQGKSVVANVKRAKQGGVSGLAETGVTIEDRGRIDRHVRLEASKRDGARSIEGAFSLNDFRGDGDGDGARVRLNDAGAPIIESKVRGYFKSRSPDMEASAALGTPLLGGALRLHFTATADRNAEGYYDDLVVPGSVETLRDEKDEFEAELAARYTRTLGPRTGLDAIGVARGGDTETRSAFDASSPARSSRFSLKKRSSEIVGRATLKHEALPVLSLEAGGEIALNTLRSNTDLTVNGAPQALSAANVTVKEERGEIFSTATWRARPYLTLETGVRIEASSISSEGDVTLAKTLAYVKPRVAAALDLPGDAQVRLRAEYEVDQLSFEDFAASSSLGTGVVVVGNPDLNPERQMVLEAAFEKRFWRDGAFLARYAHAKLQDVTDFAPVVTSSGVESVKANIGQGDADELELALTLPLQRVGVPGGLLKPSATWTHSRIVDPTTGQERARSSEAPLSWSVVFTQDSPIWPLVWGVEITGDAQSDLFRVGEIVTTKKDPKVELFADIKLPQDWALRVDVRNITKRDEARWREVYVGPRSDNDLNYRDVRTLNQSPELNLRIRKRF